MILHLTLLALTNLLFLTTESLASDLDAPLTDSQLQQLLEREERYQGDLLRDVDRRPAKILKFADVARADVVIDLYAGGGWYTELFSIAVGSGYKAANDLHRIDPNIVRHQLDAAGFELQEEAFYLRNPNDDLSKLVFDPR